VISSLREVQCFEQPEDPGVLLPRGCVSPTGCLPPHLHLVLTPPPSSTRALVRPHTHCPTSTLSSQRAGAPALLAAIAHGAPGVCAGLGEEKVNVATGLAWSGAGLDLRTGAPAPEEIRQAVACLGVAGRLSSIEPRARWR
jgi:hypothetical protein